MKVRLSKVIGGVNIRTNTVEGECDSAPTVGKSFVMIGESLTSPEIGFRMVSTSEIQEILPRTDGIVLIKTLNSVYELEYIN